MTLLSILFSIIEANHIEAIRDSVSSLLPLLRELAANSSPEPYTIENLWWTKLNVAISITAALIGGLGAYYGYKGFVYAKETALNVLRLPQDTQISLCLSLLHDLLVNYVRALVILCNRQHGEKLPSDNYISTFLLPEFEDIFSPESFYQNGSAFVCLNYIKMRMKHYNHMIEVIESHCLNGFMTDKDCQDLIVKTSKVIRSVLAFIREINGSEHEIKHNLIEKIIKQTNGRPETVQLTDENKLMFRTMVAAMYSHPGVTKFDNAAIGLSTSVRDAILQLSGKELDNSTINATELLAYNGVIEMQYLA